MFIALEGIDGAGKSTQAELLKQHIEAERGRPVLLVREPGGTPLAEALRKILLDPASGDLPPEVELFLFLAARAHLVRERIRPALERKIAVIADRFTWSTVCYQGIAGGLGRDTVLAAGRIATGGLEPDFVVVLDLEPRAALSRFSGRDRMEGKGEAYLAAVRQGFLELAGMFPERSAVVDASGPPEDVAERIVGVIPWEKLER